MILFDLDHRHLTLRHFVMGIARVDEPGRLRLATREQQLAFLGGLKRKRPARDGQVLGLDELPLQQSFMGPFGNRGVGQDRL